MECRDTKARVIAFYLPQYYPTDVNDRAWGKGFTEWTNVAKAKPQFRGHYQPQIPADLGFYDLRLPEVREEQAQLAKEHGVEGFCYWHYWLGNGRKLLDLPFREVLESGKPDFPFCLGWANHSWSKKTWTVDNNAEDTMIAEQLYPGEEDYINHFYDVLPAFKDKRYITVEGKPLFLVYDPFSIPDTTTLINIWNKLARKNGLSGVYFVARPTSISLSSRELQSLLLRNKKDKITKMSEKRYHDMMAIGYDGICSNTITYAELMAGGSWKTGIRRFINKYTPINMVQKYEYREIIKYLNIDAEREDDIFPSIIPRFDRTPREPGARVFANSTPELFHESVQNALGLIMDKEYDKRILFLVAWNEWGEGNYIEPDLKFGHGYLEALRDCILS